MGSFELDESYFGAKRVRGKRVCRAAVKTPVFGILKRNGFVYVEVVENCKKESLMPTIQEKNSKAQLFSLINGRLTIDLS